MKLITIPFSHFCEKARWGLEHFKVAYEEEPHLPLFHVPAVRRIHQAHHKGKSTSTPVLITDEGDVYDDSRKILRFLSDTYGEGSLYPNDLASTLENSFNDVLAPATRCYAYIHILGDRKFYKKIMSDNALGFEKRSVSILAPVTTRILKKVLRADHSRLPKMQARIDDELKRVGEILGDKPFLAGDSFSAADIAFACALAPALRISTEEGYGAKLPGPAFAPKDYRDDAERWRKTKAAKHALKLFAEYR